MKILFVLPNDYYGGAETVIKKLTIHLSKENDVYIFILTKKQGYFYEDLINTYNIQVFYGLFSSELLSIIPFIFKLLLLKNKFFDLIFTSHVNINSFISIILKLKILRKKYFVVRESTRIFERYDKSNKILYYKMLYFLGYNSTIDLWICQTIEMKTQLLNNIRKEYLFNKINVIHNPYDKSLNTNNNFISSSPYLVACGRFVPDKGFDVLIKSFNLFLKDYPSYLLYIIGSGIEYNNLNQLIEELNLNTKVILLGKINTPKFYFYNSKACIMSSIFEGFPNTLLEMMECNNNIVSTLSTNSISQINGIYTCQPNSYVDLKNTIVKCINTNNSSNRIYFDNYLNEINSYNFINKMFKILSI
jgi:glycosyltransferase involved in cell wall biosynthesis